MSLTAQRYKLICARIDPDLLLGIHSPQHSGDCGWDLSSQEDVTLWPHEALDVPINARIQLPQGFWAEMRPRSSMAKRGLQVECGIIDNGYLGPLFVVCRNMKSAKQIRDDNNSAIYIKAGDRIAQLIFHKLHDVWHEEGVIDLAASERGVDGFGSTGR